MYVAANTDKKCIYIFIYTQTCIYKYAHTNKCIMYL